MNPVKQALIAFKNNWKESLYLGVAATLFIFFSQIVPFAGAFLISLGLLIFQELVNLRLQIGKWKLDLTHLRSHWVSLLITAIILMPTGILLGSAFGLLQSPQNNWQSLPTSLGLFIMGIYFYMILSHGFNLQQERGIGIAKALDIAALVSIRNFKVYLIASFYISIALMIGGLLKGAGFVLALPFLFYVDYLIFSDLKDAKKYL